MVSGWFPEEHFRYFVEAVASYAGVAFDRDDWIGLEYDLIRREQPEGERVVVWPFGTQPVTFSHEPGDGVIAFSLNADRALELRVETLADVLADAAPDAFDGVRSAADAAEQPAAPAQRRLRP